MSDTKKINQLKIYEFIKSYIEERDYSPSVREICKAVGVNSTSTVHNYLNALEKDSLIKRDPFKPRTIRIPKNSSNKKKMVNIPIIDSIIIGNSIFSPENIKGSLPIPVDYTENMNNLFIIKAYDESMAKIKILIGDMVIFEKTDHVENGEIASVLLDNKIVMGRFFKKENYIKLQPESTSMKPIIIVNYIIIGKLVGTGRFFT
jgi:repressor LexA